MPTYTDVDLAYFAGLIDGEGSFWGVSQARPGRNGKTSRALRVGLDIWNTDERLIDWVHNRFGGMRGVQDKKESWKPVFFVRISGKSLSGFLPEVADHLVAKRRHAELVQEFIDKPRVSWRKPEHADYRARREEIVAEIKRLNQRGRKS